MSDWSELLPELLVEIAKCVAPLPDQVSFGGVCKSWRSVALTIKNFNLSLPRFPFLLFAEEHEEEEGEVESDRLRKLLILPSLMGNLRLPEASKRHCASSRGWLLTIGEDNNDVNLLHPLTRQQIILPKFDTFAGINNCDCGENALEDFFDEDHVHDYNRHNNQDQHFVSKMVLSCDPLSEDDDKDCLVMVTWGNSRRLGFCRPGDVSWTDLAGWFTSTMDITYHNQMLYGVTSNGIIMACDVHHSNPKIFKVVDESTEISEFLYVPSNFNSRLYVLAGFDDKKLLMVVRVLKRETYGSGRYLDYETRMLHVLELNLETNRWSRVKNLGERAVFLGFNSSMWIAADDSTVKPNCIYFTDDLHELYKHSIRGGGKDTGVYNLSEGIVFKRPQFNVDSCSRVSPPIWIEPTL